jgi:hypothetical protein
MSRPILRDCVNNATCSSARLHGSFPALAVVSTRQPPELTDLQRLIDEAEPHLQVRVLCEVQAGPRRFPVHAITLGNPSPEVPAVGFFGGVHGLERIGAEVVTAYLRSLVSRLPWDTVLQQQLEGVRLVFMPLVNPGGLWLGTRANPNGVDLMRNAPVEAAEPVPFMLGGQRISRGLPWFRGNSGEPMEAESRALCELVEQELLSRSFSLAVDCHSGFGSEDRIWFPYAHTVKPILHLPEMYALRSIFQQSHAHHRYVFEPQSLQYRTHGDLWDYLYLRAIGDPRRIFMPLTLEMGSWLWIKKNPRQIFSRFGIFNPLIGHRQQRVMRRHIALLDFFTRAASGHRHWLPTAGGRQQCLNQALAAWYSTDRNGRHVAEPAA